MSALANKVAALIIGFNDLNADAKTIDQLTIKPVSILGGDEMSIYTVATDVTEKITMTTLTSYLTSSLTLTSYQLKSEKGAINGYAGLDSSGLVPSTQLPSYVDDVLEFTNLASFPTTGETGKIYIALDSGRQYRWSGASYVEVSAVDLINDLTPQLGGDLDMNGHNISSNLTILGTTFTLPLLSMGFDNGTDVGIYADNNLRLLAGAVGIPKNLSLQVGTATTFLSLVRLNGTNEDVKLYQGTTERLATTTSGVTITGILNAETGFFSKSVPADFPMTLQNLSATGFSGIKLWDELGVKVGAVGYDNALNKNFIDTQAGGFELRSDAGDIITTSFLHTSFGGNINAVGSITATQSLFSTFGYLQLGSSYLQETTNFVFSTIKPKFTFNKPVDITGSLTASSGVFNGDITGNSTTKFKSNGTAFPTSSIGAAAGRHIFNGTAPVVILYNESAAAANNLSELFIGAKAKATGNFFGGGIIKAGIVNGTDNKGFLDIYTYNATAQVKAISIDSSQNVAITGALSKGSGSFKIDHPLKKLEDTNYLVHSFVEAPKADLIYRGKVRLVNGKATVNIDEVSTMTDGTFDILCQDVQCFTTNESGWDLIKGSVKGNILTIESKSKHSEDTISWMVIGERKDKHMLDTSWTDKKGKVIVEPAKEIKE